jgi:hypothetical protein
MTTNELREYDGPICACDAAKLSVAAAARKSHPTRILRSSTTAQLGIQANYAAVNASLPPPRVRDQGAQMSNMRWG